MFQRFHRVWTPPPQTFRSFPSTSMFWGPGNVLGYDLHQEETKREVYGKVPVRKAPDITDH